MTLIQEDALYEFLENTDEEFMVDDVVSHVRKKDPTRSIMLAEELTAFINRRKLAFNAERGKWLSRRAFFSPLSFVINPTRLELSNGILIPGHRCVPFANSNLLPHEYTFFYKNKEIPFTTSEAAPEEFYPYYVIFGEEYAPQYVARDNSKNEEAFFMDPYEDPPEVSIKTVDMRKLYMEMKFIPGDRFLVTTLNWKKGNFLLEKIPRDTWSKHDLNSWFTAAEEAFERSFNTLGPGSCTEEQLAYAYWLGSSRLREVPAYSLDEYLYDRSDKIEVAPYGIETRYWYAGREIPDQVELDNLNIRPDATPLEVFFLLMNIPISEFVVQSFIRDSLFREGGDPELIRQRLIPVQKEIDEKNSKLLDDYIMAVIREFKVNYNIFTDKRAGPIRTRAVEMHKSVIELEARLNKSGIDTSWLPRHTFIILSQIQMHTSGVLEDLGSDESPTEEEMDALDSSLDSMVETYEDIKELINESIKNFRRNNFTLVQAGDTRDNVFERLIQISIGSLDVWRRLIIPENYTLEDLHKVIQAGFEWNDTHPYRYSSEKNTAAVSSLQEEEKTESGSPLLFIVRNNQRENSMEDLSSSIKEMCEIHSSGLFYEYGSNWNVRIMFLSRHETAGHKPVRCVAGQGNAPPEFIAGPIRFKRVLNALENGSDLDRSYARQELGPNFVPGEFNIDNCNRRLKMVFNQVN